MRRATLYPLRMKCSSAGLTLSGGSRSQPVTATLTVALTGLEPAFGTVIARFPDGTEQRIAAAAGSAEIAHRLRLSGGSQHGTVRCDGAGPGRRQRPGAGGDAHLTGLRVPDAHPRISDPGGISTTNVPRSPGILSSTAERRRPSRRGRPRAGRAVVAHGAGAHRRGRSQGSCRCWCWCCCALALVAFAARGASILSPTATSAQLPRVDVGSAGGPVAGDDPAHADRRAHGHRGVRRCCSWPTCWCCAARRRLHPGVDRGRRWPRCS